jgi:hypothetical protein
VRAIESALDDQVGRLQAAGLSDLAERLSEVRNEVWDVVVQLERVDRLTASAAHRGRGAEPHA